LPIVYATPTGRLSHSPDGARQATDSVVCRHFPAHHWLDRPDQVRVLSGWSTRAKGRRR
jgi:hypothetical protein